MRRVRSAWRFQSPSRRNGCTATKLTISNGIYSLQALGPCQPSRLTALIDERGRAAGLLNLRRTPIIVAHLRSFARLILAGAYEATLAAAELAAAQGGSNLVLFTRLGGAASGNEDAWIDDAMVRALSLFANSPLDVRLISYGHVPVEMRALEALLRKRG